MRGGEEACWVSSLETSLFLAWNTDFDVWPNGLRSRFTLFLIFFFFFLPRRLLWAYLYIYWINLPHMPLCLPESSSPRSTGSASTTPSPRTWSTGSAAARASASRRAGSGAVGARTTPTAATGPNGPALCQEMEGNQEGEGKQKRTEGQGSLCLEYPRIPPSDPIRGETTSLFPVWVHVTVSKISQKPISRLYLKIRINYGMNSYIW